MSKDKQNHLDIVKSLVANGDNTLTKVSAKGDVFRELAKEYVRSKQRAALNGTGPRLVTNKAAEVSPIYQVDPAGVVSVLQERDLESDLYQNYMTGTASEIKDVVKLIKYELYSQTIDLDKVASVALKDDPTLTWNRLPFTLNDVKQITLEELPEFKHFLSMCDESAESLVLWTGSLLDATSSRSQYLHIQSGGGNGKSTFLESLKRVFSTDKVLAVDSGHFNDQYFGEALEGARILAFPDENNTSFFSSGKFKRFTGEDSTTINPKFKASRNIKFTHKTIVLSNHEVQITSGEADVRRLVSVVMKADTETGGHRWWYEGLKTSGAKILAYCYGRYLAAVEADPSVRSFIPVNKALVRKAIERTYEEQLDAFYAAYEYSEDGKDRVLKSDIHKYLCDEFREPRGKIFLLRVKDALAGIGIESVAVNGRSYYKNVKRILINAPRLQEKKV